MGFLGSIKKSLGMSAGELEVRVQPEGCFVGGEISGEVVVRAQKDLNIFSVQLDLIHSFRDDYGSRQHEIFDGFPLAERISLGAGEQHVLQFFFKIPPQLAPSVGDFAWSLRAQAHTQSHGVLQKEQAVQLRLSPVTSAVVACIQEQFGFSFQEAGADEDGIWMSFAPGAAIKAHKRALEISFDEREDELLLWVALDPFARSVLERYHEDFDASEGSIELELEKDRYMAGGQVDRQGIYHLLQPLFAL